MIIRLLSRACIRLTDYLVGTGGWAYFNVPGEPRLKAYSQVFNFVEVNYTFYEYPDTRMVAEWRRMVPEDFTFTVRCHQDLTHRIGLKPVDKAYEVLGRMVFYCGLLEAPFLVLETPAHLRVRDTGTNLLYTLLGCKSLRDYQLSTPTIQKLRRQLGFSVCVS